MISIRKQVKILISNKEVLQN